MSAHSVDNEPETSTKGEKPLQHLHNTFGKAGYGNGVLPCIQSQLKQHYGICRSKKIRDKNLLYKILKALSEKLPIFPGLKGSVKQNSICNINN